MAKRATNVCVIRITCLYKGAKSAAARYLLIITVCGFAALRTEKLHTSAEGGACQVRTPKNNAAPLVRTHARSNHLSFKRNEMTHRAVALDQIRLGDALDVGRAHALKLVEQRFEALVAVQHFPHA